MFPLRWHGWNRAALRRTQGLFAGRRNRRRLAEFITRHITWARVDDMVRSITRMTAVVVCLAGVASPDDTTPDNPPGAFRAIEGIWHGAWGGGEANGAVFQPAMAELFIEGDHVELHGSRDANRLTGTVRFDANAKPMHITPAAEPGGRPSPKSMTYCYSISKDALTLVGSDRLEQLPPGRGQCQHGRRLRALPQELDEPADEPGHRFAQPQRGGLFRGSSGGSACRCPIREDSLIRRVRTWSRGSPVSSARRTPGPGTHTPGASSSRSCRSSPPSGPT